MDFKTMKTLLKNYYSHPRYALKQLTSNPISSLKVLKGMMELEKFVRDLTSIDVRETRIYTAEIISNKGFRKHLEESFNYFADKSIASGDIGTTLGTALYIIVRKLRPDTIIETGVANGISSAYILCALGENKHGRLYSIDLPYEEGREYPKDQFAAANGQDGMIPKGRQSGWIIPDYLRDRWELILGRTSEKLPSLLQKVGEINMFLHDSEHTYQNMLWEYETAWVNLKAGGLLLSHNVDLNDAFSHFQKSISLGTTSKNKGCFLANMGGLVKSE